MQFTYRLRSWGQKPSSVRLRDSSRDACDTWPRYLCRRSVTVAVDGFGSGPAWQREWVFAKSARGRVEGVGLAGIVDNIHRAAG